MSHKEGLLISGHVLTYEVVSQQFHGIPWYENLTVIKHAHAHAHVLQYKTLLY